MSEIKNAANAALSAARRRDTTAKAHEVTEEHVLVRRGKGAAFPGALVRPLPRVLAVVAVQGGLLRPSIAAARPGALVRPLPRVHA